MTMISKQKAMQGFTLIEVLVAATIIGLVAITQIPRLQGFLDERVRDEAVGDVRKLSNSLRQFRSTQNADPISVAQLIGSDFYDGNQTLPWGAPFTGVPIQIQNPNSPQDPTRQVSAGWVFSFEAQDIEQAALISEELGDLQAQVVGEAGTTVQWTVNASLLEVNQFQFIARTEEGQQLCPDCNEVEVDLDFRDSGSIDNVQGFDASQGQIVEASVGQVTLDESNNITMQNNNLTVNANQAQLSGSMQVAQDLQALGDTRIQGNASIAGDTTIQGDTTIGGDATINGDVTGGFFNASGDFSTQLTSLNTNRGLIDLNDAALLQNSQNIGANLTAIGVNASGIAGNASANGANLGLNNANVGRLNTLSSTIGSNTSRISGNDGLITRLRGDVNANTSGRTANSTRISQLNTQVERIRMMIESCTTAGGCLGI